MIVNLNKATTSIEFIASCYYGQNHQSASCEAEQVYILPHKHLIAIHIQDKADKAEKRHNSCYNSKQLCEELQQMGPSVGWFGITTFLPTFLKGVGPSYKGHHYHCCHQQQHRVLGFRFGNIAYITDMSEIEDSELEKLRGLEHLTLNTVSYHPHHSHFSLQEAVALAQRIGASHTWLTHLSHTFPTHGEFVKELRQYGNIEPAYDGLVIED